MRNFISAVDTTMTGRTKAVCIRCGDPRSSHYVIVLPILLARDKLRFVLYPLLPCRARSQRGSCLDRACLIVRRRLEEIMVTIRSIKFFFMFLLHCSPFSFSRWYVRSKTFHLFQSGSSLKHLHIPCLRRSSLVVSREDPYHFRRCCGPRTGICGKR